MTVNIFVFDIETVPDTATGKRIYQLPELDEADIAQTLFNLRRQETGGSDFLRLHLQRIVAISVVFRSRNSIKVWSLGDTHASEKELITRFFEGIEKYSPVLVSWNGGGFDLPVLHYRALLHGIPAPRYWEHGEQDSHFRWNNYLNRYHYRHLDIMDVLAAYQGRAVAPLDEIAIMLGQPGKLGMSGAQVWEYFQQGRIEAIRNYCETDCLNTYLIYLRFELMRGKLSSQQYQEECTKLEQLLRLSDQAHLQSFLQAWQAAKVAE